MPSDRARANSETPNRCRRPTRALLASLAIHAALFSVGGFVHHKAQRPNGTAQQPAPTPLMVALWPSPPPQAQAPTTAPSRPLRARDQAVHSLAPQPRQAVPKPTQTAAAAPKPTNAAPPHAQPVNAYAAPKPASLRGTAQADYLSLLKAWFERHKSYPRRARMQSAEGEALITLTFNRAGSILTYTLTQSSGHASLDRAAIAAVESANPLPAIPPELSQNQITLNVPFGFHLK